MQSNKKVSNMKNVNTKSKSTPTTPRSRKFKGSKRSKYNKNARNQKKTIHPKFKEILNNINGIVMPKKDPTQAFKEKHFEKLYSERNFNYIDSYVLLKPELLLKIICNPMWYINRIPRIHKETSLKDYTDQAAICIFKALWLKEIPFNQVLPTGKNIWYGSGFQGEIDITSQKVRREYNEKIEKGLKDSHLSESEQLELRKLLDIFIFEYSFGFSQQFRKPERNIFATWRALSPVRLF